VNNKRQWLNEFITEVIDGWMLTDLRRLLNDIPHRPNAAGNCNFPIALYVFACIEFLGQLTSVTPINTNQGGYTTNSIIGFINDFFPDDFKQKIQPYQNNFVNIFRNGLAHNYFAKNAGISRTEIEPLQVNEQGMLVLDADRFAEAFIASIIKLKEVIRIDSNLADRIVDRYGNLYQDHLRFQFTPTTTRISTASLAHPDTRLTTTTPPPPPKETSS